MKKRNFIIVFAIVLALVGCQELIGSFTASINGVAWTASVSGAVKQGPQYIITATKDTSVILITIPGLTVGNYIINPMDTTLDAVVYTPNTGTPAKSYIGTQGDVNLSKVSLGRLTGTFAVWAKNTQNPNDSIPLSGQFSNILSN